MDNNMADLFGKMNEMQEKMKQAQESLGELEITSEVGGGMVKVTANGNRQIQSIKLEKDIIDPEDPDMLEDLIIAGVNKALNDAEEAGKKKMQEITKDMLPGGGIPGMDMSKFGL
jgi:DNA-binding YbaB/EbfC family protein